MEHPILFLDLLFGSFGLHIPPHLSYAVLVALILVGLGWLAGRQINQSAQRGALVSRGKQSHGGVDQVSSPDEMISTLIKVAFRLSPRNRKRGDECPGISLIFVSEQYTVAAMI